MKKNSHYRCWSGRRICRGRKILALTITPDTLRPKIKKQLRDLIEDQVTRSDNKSVILLPSFQNSLPHSSQHSLVG